MSQLNPFAFPGLQDPSGAVAPLAPPPTAPPIPKLTEEDKQTLLEKIGSAGLGGLSFIGGILNKPGRIIRGALGGHFDELGNLVPFSDTLGITNPEREVRGTDLLDNLGVTKNAGDAGFFSPEGLAGFAVDVATDPLTYATFGGHALTKAGLAAKKANVLPKSIAARIAGATPEIEAATGGAVRAGETLGGHVGFGIPGMGNQITADLSGVGRALQSGIQAIPGGQSVLNAAGRVGDLYNATIPPLFEKAVKGQTDPVAQAAARAATEALPGSQAELNARLGEILNATPEVAAGGSPTLEGARRLRQELETFGPVRPEYNEAVSKYHAYNADQLAQANRLGLPDQPLGEDLVNYATRQLTQAQPRGVGPFGATMKPAKALPPREGMFKGLYTENDINNLSRDPALLPLRDAYNAGQKQPFIDHVTQNVVGVDKAELADLKNQARTAGLPGATHTPDLARLAELETKTKQAENLADWVATSVPKSLAEGGLGAFDAHPIMDAGVKAMKDAGRFLNAEGLHNAVAGMANFQEPGVSLETILKNAGLTYKDAQGNMTAMQRTLEAMQSQGKLPKGATLADMADWSIPYDQADRVTKFTKAATAPAGLKPFLDIWDSVTNLTKAFQTTLWPANWARNKAQSLFQNWTHDGFNAQAEGVMKYLKPSQDASAWYKGKTIEGASQYPGLTHLDDAGATRVLNSEIENYKVASAFKHPEQDVVGGDVAIRQLLPSLPGQAQKPIGDILKGAVPRSFAEANPLNVAGVGGLTEDVFAPVKAGREFGSAQHSQDRVATYLAKRSQGYAPEAALNEVKLAHYDFSNMTGFEKDVLKRVIPFYSFMRQNIPAIITELGENPGGKLATTLKAVNEAKGEHPGFIPQQISSGIAAPIGQEENGQQRYLTHLGLGFEDLGSLAGPGGVLGQLNPLIKAPIESLTGRQLISGRDLADLHSRIGDTTGIVPPPALENAIMNSPLSRAIGTASTLVDPRKSILDKSLNTLTGVRVSDVDVDKSRRQAVLDYLTSQLHGPGVNRFENLSVRPDQFQNLSPFEQQLYMLYRSQQGRNPAPLATSP